MNNEQCTIKIVQKTPMCSICRHPHTYRFSFYSSEHCPSFLCASVYVCKCYIFVPQPQTAPDVTAKVEDFTPFSHEFTIDGIFFYSFTSAHPINFLSTQIHTYQTSFFLYLFHVKIILTWLAYGSLSIYIYSIFGMSIKRFV